MVRPSEWFTATVRYASYWSVWVDVSVPEAGGAGALGTQLIGGSEIWLL